MAAVQARAPGDTTITSAAWVPAANGAPRHCLVDGQVQVPGNTVRFRVGLPEGWNGKFYFQGVGGLGGTIGDLRTGLTRGYASASTDTGHDADDPGWGRNRAKGDRLRPSRYARDGRRGQGPHCRLLPAATGACLLQRLLQRRSPGADGSAALPRRLRRRDRRRSGLRYADAGRPCRALPADAGHAGQLPPGGEGRAAVGPDARRLRRHRWPRGWSHLGSARVPVRADRPPVHLRRRSGLPHRRAGRGRARCLHRSQGPRRQGVHAAVPAGPRGRVKRLARLDHRHGAAGRAARRLADVRRQGARRLHVDGRQFPFPGARRRCAGLFVAHVQVPRRPASAGDDDPDLGPARHRPAAVRHGRRQAARLPRLGRSRHLRARHSALRRGGDASRRRPGRRGCLSADLLRAGHAPLQRRTRRRSVRHADRARAVGRGRGGAGPDRGVAGRRRRDRALASAVSASAGGELQRRGQHRRRGQFRLPAAPAR